MGPQMSLAEYNTKNNIKHPSLSDSPPNVNPHASHPLPPLSSPCQSKRINTHGYLHSHGNPHPITFNHLHIHTHTNTHYHHLQPQPCLESYLSTALPPPASNAPSSALPPQASNAPSNAAPPPACNAPSNALPPPACNAPSSASNPRPPTADRRKQKEIYKKK